MKLSLNLIFSIRKCMILGSKNITLFSKQDFDQCKEIFLFETKFNPFSTGKIEKLDF